MLAYNIIIISVRLVPNAIVIAMIVAVSKYIIFSLSCIYRWTRSIPYGLRGCGFEREAGTVYPCLYLLILFRYQALLVGNGTHQPRLFWTWQPIGLGVLLVSLVLILLCLDGHCLVLLVQQ